MSAELSLYLYAERTAAMLAITDRRIPAKCAASLTRLGFKTVALPPFPALPQPVASHPDMLIFIHGGTLLTHRDYYTIAKHEIKRILKAGRFTLLLSDEHISSTYPEDILFNAAPAGRFIFAKKDAISRHIIKIAERLELTIIDIKQGYARCSIASAGRSAIITSDRKTAQAAQTHGIDALAIRPGHVRLDGYDTGFIGGASGCLEDKLFLCGSLGTHPDGNSVREFCSIRGVEVVELYDGELIDVGSLFFV